MNYDAWKTKEPKEPELCGPCENDGEEECHHGLEEDRDCFEAYIESKYDD